MPTYGDVAQFMEKIAPSSTAMQWDNVGLLIGSAHTEVTGCMVALDVTLDVLEAAEMEQANLIITHHPVIFQPLYSIPGDGRIAHLLQSGIGVLSAHTNLDLAEGGVNHALCSALGLPSGKPFANPDGVGRIVPLPKPYIVSAFAALVKRSLGAGCVKYCMGENPLQTIAVVSGAGGEYWKSAQELGASALLTGEVKHHEWVDALNMRFPIISAGHFDTEAVVLEPLSRQLAMAFPTIPMHICKIWRVESL